MPHVSYVVPPVPTPEPVSPLEKGKPHNRIRAILVHTAWYSIEGQARLAADIGVSRSTVCRIMSGRSRPSFRLVRAITESLERALGRPLDPREVFSDDGAYPTNSCCKLCGCPKGCMPEEAFERHGRIKPEYRHMRPGDWSFAVAPLKDEVSRSTTTITV